MGTAPAAINQGAGGSESGDAHAGPLNRDLAQNGAMLAWVQAIAPFGVFTTDRDLRIQSWNQWLAAHSGLAAETVIGRVLTEIFPDVGERRLDEYFQRALAGEMSVLSTALHKYLLPLRPAGRGSDPAPMLQTVRIAPLVFEGKTVGAIATIEDVTQRETQALVLRKQQEYDRLLSSALAIFLAAENPLKVASELFPRITTPLKLEVYLNYLIAPDGSEMRLHAAGGITPEARKKLAVHPVAEGPLGTSASSRDVVHIPSVHEDLSDQTTAIRKMGLKVYVGFPLVIGDRLLGTLAFGSYEREFVAPDEIEFLTKVAQYLAIAIERALRENALHQAQQSLREHAEILETKIEERTAKLHETIAQLESFSYTIAHDLRAPIRSLKGYSEILLSDFANNIPEAGQGMLQRISRASNRLDALTRDLLAFSKIARQDVQLAAVNLDELIHDLIATTPALSSVVMVHAPLGSVVAQRTLLEQCLSNLFDNAVKFSKAGVAPRIVVRTELRVPDQTPDPAMVAAAAFHPPTHRRDHEAKRAKATTAGAVSEPDAGCVRRIWVEDNGIGVAPNSHQKIFGIFERVSGLDNVEGTGIGLAIVARAMQQMGGACGVESDLGVGSRFWLELSAA